MTINREGPPETTPQYQPPRIEISLDARSQRALSRLSHASASHTSLHSCAHCVSFYRNSGENRIPSLKAKYRSVCERAKRSVPNVRVPYFVE